MQKFPKKFKSFVEYTKNLGYLENPDYDTLGKNFLVLVRKRMCQNFDFIYDWTSKK